MREHPALSLILAVFAFSLAGAVSACGDDDSGPDEFEGMYEVSSHQMAQDGCDALQPVEDPSTCFACRVESPFIKLKMNSFMGGRWLAIVECADAATCDDDDDDPNTINLSGPIFQTKKNGQWIGEMHAAGGSGTSCSYTYGRYLIDETEVGIRVTLEEHRSYPTVANTDECLDLTDNPPPADTLTCEDAEVIEATRIEALQ